MSNRVEWDTTHCELDVLTAREAQVLLRPDEPIVADLVLAIGGAIGGAFAIEGTAAELGAFADRIYDAVAAATRRFTTWDNVEDRAVRRFSTRERANGLCRSLNLDHPGGRSVRPPEPTNP